MNNVKKDAMEYVKAKLEYGEGAGLLRRKVNAKLATKLQDENYAKMFNEEVAALNQAKIQNEIDTVHKIKAVKDFGISGLKTGKKILAGLGITAVTVVPLCIKHRHEISSCAKKVGRKIKRKAHEIKERIKSKFKKEPTNDDSYLDKIDYHSYNVANRPF